MFNALQLDRKWRLMTMKTGNRTMKIKTYLALGSMTACLFSIPAASFAEQATPLPVAATTQADPVSEQVQYLQKQWAVIKYQTANEDTQLDGLHKLEDYAAKVSASYPGRAEPKIWEGIILSTDAGIDGGFGALGKVKQAKALFEAALAIDPTSLAGSAHTSLGSLYYQVPGWPLAFGDNDKAEEHLKAALKINPDGIDPNYFYSDFLIEEERYDEAATYLQRALNAAPRPDRPVADAGRRQEIQAAQEKLQKKLKRSKKHTDDKGK